MGHLKNEASQAYVEKPSLNRNIYKVANLLFDRAIYVTAY